MSLSCCPYLCPYAQGIYLNGVIVFHITMKTKIPLKNAVEKLSLADSKSCVPVYIYNSSSSQKSIKNKAKMVYVLLLSK